MNTDSSNPTKKRKKSQNEKPIRHQPNDAKPNEKKNIDIRVVKKIGEPSKVSTSASVNKKRKRNKRAKRYIQSNLSSQKLVNSKTTVVTFPQEKDNYSSNWMKLKEILETDKKHKMESSPVSSRKRKTNVVRNGKEKVLAASPKFFKGSNKQSSRIPVNVKAKVSPPEIWFDGVDPELIEKPVAISENRHPNIGLVQIPKTSVSNSPTQLSKKLTNALAMDCEMVGVGEDAQDSILARVSLVNVSCSCVYDKFVLPTEPVTDYRTAVSGIRPSDLEKGESFQVVQKEVSDILKGRILVGHAVYNDLKVLFLGHPRSKTRDTSLYKPFRQLFGGSNPSLKKLAEKLLNVKVQEGEHNSVEDAKVTMRIYSMFRKKWECEVRSKRQLTKKIKATPTSPGLSNFSKLKI